MNVANTPWKPTLHDDVAKQASTIARDVAQRCCSMATIQKAIDYGRNDTAIRWNTPSVAGGDAGIALLAAYMHACFPGQGWDAATHTYLSQAVNAYGHHHPGYPNLGLFTGVSGLAFTALLASQAGTHYAGLRQDLDTYLRMHTATFLRRAQSTSLRVGAYDLISGATGIATYLISRNQAASAVDLTKSCHRVLQYVVTLTKPNADGAYCFIAPETITYTEKRDAYPNGYSDCGLAHGVAGIIGVLARAISNGWSVPGMEEGLAALAHWLASQKVQDAYGINWPTVIEPYTAGVSLSPAGSRAAWCYGIPGVARALYLAGQALDDKDLCNTAISAFDSLMARPRARWGIFSPNLCHGLSGVLQASLRMYHDTGHVRWLPFIQTLSEELLSLYDQKSFFGFQDKRYMHGTWYDNPRLLEGAPGVALVLLAASRPTPPDWDRLFLLS